MNMYQPTSETASPYYDFRRDFDSIARPAMVRYLKHLATTPTSRRMDSTIAETRREPTPPPYGGRSDGRRDSPA
jgi:hypothetical protein